MCFFNCLSMCCFVPQESCDTSQSWSHGHYLTSSLRSTDGTQPMRSTLLTFCRRCWSLIRQSGLQRPSASNTAGCSYNISSRRELYISSLSDDADWWPKRQPVVALSGLKLGLHRQGTVWWHVSLVTLCRGEVSRCDVPVDVFGVCRRCRRLVIVTSWLSALRHCWWVAAAAAWW